MKFNRKHHLTRKDFTSSAGTDITTADNEVALCFYERHHGRSGLPSAPYQEPFFRSFLKFSFTKCGDLLFVNFEVSLYPGIDSIKIENLAQLLTIFVPRLPGLNQLSVSDIARREEIGGYTYDWRGLDLIVPPSAPLIPDHRTYLTGVIGELKKIRGNTAFWEALITDLNALLHHHPGFEDPMYANILTKLEQIRSINPHIKTVKVYISEMRKQAAEINLGIAVDAATIQNLVTRIGALEGQEWFEAGAAEVMANRLNALMGWELHQEACGFSHSP